ncbi:MAG TPA: hypothetical protein VGP66_11905 [Candidatus Acidoferrum sp.]|jgi:hypothetical protein|nr:hypothetical protein [Candidatus Acidoferrum sp.]
MEETIAGASAFPTLTMPDATQTGNAAADDLFAFTKITTATNAAAMNNGDFPIRKIGCPWTLPDCAKLESVFMIFFPGS